MRRINHAKAIQASLPNIYEYEAETIECNDFEIISPDRDTEECQSQSCASSIVVAGRLRLQRNAKAA